MNVSLQKANLKSVKDESLIAFLFEGQKIDPELDEITGGAISALVGRGVEVQKFLSVNQFTVPFGKSHKHVITVGLGKTEGLTPTYFKQAVMAGVRTLLPLRVKSATVCLGKGVDTSANVGLATLAAVEAVYQLSLHQTKVQPVRLEQVTVALDRSVTNQDRNELSRTLAIADCVNIARSLVNHPSNVVTPLYFVNEAKKLARKHNLSVKVLNEKEINRLGMGAFAAVAKGSDEQAYLVELYFKAKSKSAQTLGLVGKGITFDSGGISIKPSEGLDQMKMDMAGGAAVLGAMIAIAQTKPDVNVLGLIPLTENLPSGKAIKPGDVVKSLSGKTIEIANTDAEGRLVLADTLAWAQKKGATHLVDIATLTGSIVATLGDFMAGLWAHPQDFGNLVVNSGEALGERYHPMPMLAEYGELVKSYIADLSNIGSGGKKAGAITAAKFLENFVDQNTPWAHLDIAGTAWLEQDMPYNIRGATGFGVATLVNLAHKLGSNQ